MNFKDLALLKSHQIVDGRVYYYRSKTGKEVPNFKVHKVAREILGIYDCKENFYVMPYIYDSVHRTDRSKDCRVKKVRKKLIRELRQVFKSLSIKDPLRPFYCARYTFALHLS